MNNTIINTQTYFLFARNENSEIIDFIGPIFEDEIESNKVEFFDNLNNVEILEEELFKLIHFDFYKKDFIVNYVDYISTFLIKQNLENEIIEFEDEEGNVLHEIVFSENYLCIYQDDNNDLNIKFDLEINPIFSAYLSIELFKYCEKICDVKINEYTEEELNEHFLFKLKSGIIEN